MELSGTVTLLLGDLDSSPRAWERDPEKAEKTLLELDELVSDLVERHGGYRSAAETVAEGFVAVFGQPFHAVTCALALQVANGDGAHQLRLSLHSGGVVSDGGDRYSGQAIVRGRRLRDVGHGGQILMSASTRELVIDDLPDGATLVDKGVHWLKNLSRPERVYQLAHPAVRVRFPPLRSMEAARHNLPVQRTSFIGRAEQIRELIGLVSNERLVTLTGAGGCGKTRLALQTAEGVIDRWPDGVWFADLSQVAGDESVAEAMARAIRVMQGAIANPRDAILAHLASSQTLLVVDNCEHVLEPVAELLETILRECPGVSVLATSRQVLGLEGEVTWRVPSLSLPSDELRSETVDSWSSAESVRLFVERAIQAKTDFHLNEQNRAAVVAVCRRLDGIPLALELAAARVRMLTTAQIAEGLANRFELLTGGPRISLPRQQTLRGSLDWSYSLLTEAEQTVFRRLAVFPASFDLEAAVTVCACETVKTWQVFDLLSLLVDKNLVTIEDGYDIVRYRLLETVRAYALELLTDAGETRDFLTRHRDYYQTLAATAGAHLEGPQCQSSLEVLRVEYPNLIGALTWSRDHNDDEAFSAMIRDLAVMWLFGDRSLKASSLDAIGWIDEALTRDPRPSTKHATVLWVRALLAVYVTDFARAGQVGAEGLELAQRLGDEVRTAAFLNVLGVGADFALQTSDMFYESVSALRRANDLFYLPNALSFLAFFEGLRHPDQARAYIDEAIQVAVPSGNPFSAGLAGLARAWLDLIVHGNIHDAIETFEGVIADSYEKGLAYTALQAEAHLGLAHALNGSIDEAEITQARALELARRTGQGEYWLVPLTTAVVSAARRDRDAALKKIGEAYQVAPSVLRRCCALAVGIRVGLSFGVLEEARSQVEQMVELAGDEGLTVLVADTQYLAAWIARLAGDNQTAERVAHEALAGALVYPAKITVVDSLELLAGVAADVGSDAEAARLFGAAMEARERMGYQLCLTQRDRDVAQARESLGNADFDAAFTQGRAMSIEEAVAYAARGRGTRGRPRLGWDSLTPTEAKIVELVREGITNAEIGRKLFISPRTVQAHLSHIYSKLSVSGRTELASRAAQRAWVIPAN